MMNYDDFYKSCVTKQDRHFKKPLSFSMSTDISLVLAGETPSTGADGQHHNKCLCWWRGTGGCLLEDTMGTELRKTVEVLIDTLFFGKASIVRYFLMFFWMYSANVGIQLQYPGLRFWQISIVSPEKGDHRGDWKDSSDFQNFQRPRHFWYHLECLARNRCRRWLCGGRGYRIDGQWWTCGHVPLSAIVFRGAPFQ